MNSLGAGGAQSPFLINAANALVFGLSMWLLSCCSKKLLQLRCTDFSSIVGFLCLFGGPIANRIGLNWTLMLGAVGYPIYSWVLKLNENVDWLAWLTYSLGLLCIRITAMYAIRGGFTQYQD
jgi:hypothetical protein